MIGCRFFDLLAAPIARFQSLGKSFVFFALCDRCASHRPCNKRIAKTVIFGVPPFSRVPSRRGVKKSRSCAIRDAKAPNQNTSTFYTVQLYQNSPAKSIALQIVHLAFSIIFKIAMDSSTKIVYNLYIHFTVSVLRLQK